VLRLAAAIHEEVDLAPAAAVDGKKERVPALLGPQLALRAIEIVRGAIREREPFETRDVRTDRDPILAPNETGCRGERRRLRCAGRDCNKEP
jgi:hypothetical protein